MKKMMKPMQVILFSAIILSSINCGKKEAIDTSDCKTCRAYGAGVDQTTVEEEICSDASETAFRNKYSGREISCQ